MNWHYEKNGAPFGPVTDTQLDAAKVRGEIRANTRVWCEGWPDWKNAGEVWPAMQAMSRSSIPGAPLSARCAECGAPHAELVTLGGVMICPECKPRALDKLREGVPLGATGGFAGPWRDGKYLVVSKTGSMPNSCIKCGGPTDKLIPRTLTWHHPAIYLTIFVGIIVYLIVAMIVRKTARIQVPACARCNSRRVRNIVIGWLAFLLSIALFFLSINVVEDDDMTMWVALTGGALLLFTLIWAVGVQFILAKKITDRFVWVGKVNKDMLAKLPAWQGE